MNNNSFLRLEMDLISSFFFYFSVCFRSIFNIQIQAKLHKIQFLIGEL